MASKKLVIASDHAGYDLKEFLKKYLDSLGYDVLDVGTSSGERTDYPDHAHNAAKVVAVGEVNLGIIICGSANGVNMSANKHAGIRSAIAWLPEIASLARQHNNANMLALPARFLGEDAAKEILDAFLGAEFEGGRHQIRVDKIEKATGLVSK